MTRRRKRRADPKPLDEDRGIFKAGTVAVSLEVTPFVKKSARGDLVYIGYIDGNEIEVVIPGRRTEVTGPLRKALATYARDKTEKPADQKGLPITARGTWRSRMLEHSELKTDKVYQFMAAEWTIVEETGAHAVYGEPPRES